ncbi:MAG: hypothetical protein OEZ29_00415 [Candidatus Bathyarchaeota archaeon]|nr:hypothetical protein [Candidatus Bathyarchaeota archaeon]MDH5779041.1 hypothetical protein [Candidatus Bathyarchaeota archaeon]
MNVKMVVGILLVGIVASIFLFAAPTLAYLNGTATGDLLQTQQREQQRIREHDSDCSMLQTQQQQRLRTQNHECTCDCTQTQYQQRAEECCRNRTCTQPMNMEQIGNHHREGSEGN